MSPPPNRFPVPREEKYYSVEEYFRHEQEAEIRHEYLGGYLRAMAGASARHNMACGFLHASLFNHFLGSSCQVFMENMKLYKSINKDESFYYPDLMVTCEPSDDHPYYRHSPKFLCEVLSKNIKKDKIERYFIYKTIPSLEHYLILDPDPENALATLYARKDDWKDPVEQSTGILTIDSLDFHLDLDALYDTLSRVRND